MDSYEPLHRCWKLKMDLCEGGDRAFNHWTTSLASALFCVERNPCNGTVRTVCLQGWRERVSWKGTLSNSDELWRNDSVCAETLRWAARLLPVFGLGQFCTS